MNITLNQIRAHNPCKTGWETLLRGRQKTAADDVEFPFTDILESNGLDDTIWCLQCLGEKHSGCIRKYAVWCARQVQHIMTDQRSLDALDVVERHADGLATAAELAAAKAGADAAVKAGADAATTATSWSAAAATSWSAAAASWIAARSAAAAASDSASDSAAAAAAMADAAASWVASWAAARSAADAASWSVALSDAAKPAQTEKLREMLESLSD